MLEDAQIPIITQAPRNADGDRMKTRSIVPFILGGLLIVALIAAGAVALGLVETGNEVDTVVAKVSPIEQGDGWIAFESPDGMFSAETPGELEPNPTPAALVPGATTVEYSKEINEQLSVMVAYTEGAGLDTTDPYATLEPVSRQVAANWNGKIFGEPTETARVGRAAINFTVDEITIGSVPYELYCRLALLDTGDVLLVATLATGDPPEQQTRMLSAFVIEPAAADDDES
jgi:hypothetical protein